MEVVLMAGVSDGFNRLRIFSVLYYFNKHKPTHFKFLRWKINNCFIVDEVGFVTN